MVDSNKKSSDEEASTSRRESRDFVPSAELGSRLPHMEVRPIKASTKDLISTLDLIPGDKLEFVLIIAPVRDSYGLARAACEAAQKSKVPLKVCIIWHRDSSDTHAGDSGTELKPWVNYIDVEEFRKPSSKSWWEICRMSINGVVLVRPDEHIAWRAESDAVDDFVLEINRVFSAILGDGGTPI